MTDQIKNKETKKYELSSVWVRLFCRMLDFLFISLISFSFSLLFFINSSFTIQDLFSKLDTNTSNFDGWRIFLITIFTSLFLFIYFVVIPFFTKGYTLFKYFFKIRLFTNQKKKNFLWLIFKHEFLIWFLLVIINIIFGITCWADGNSIKIIRSIFDFNNDLTDPNLTQSKYFALGIFFKTMYSFCSIVPAILIFSMFFRNKKKAFHDLISETFVYNIIPIEEKVVKQVQEIEYSYELPGMNDLSIKKEEKINVDYQKVINRYKENKIKKESLEKHE